ncbi:hypothetical protein BGZ57DRAFT_227417 [Hyaloscypha finlandica]|nr:hypothetical protein BGZ57DRAFT_227417 [Hyaloscypha finlandica]
MSGNPTSGVRVGVLKLSPDYVVYARLAPDGCIVAQASNACGQKCGRMVTLDKIIFDERLGDLTNIVKSFRQTKIKAFIVEQLDTSMLDQDASTIGGSPSVSLLRRQTASQTSKGATKKECYSQSRTFNEYVPLDLTTFKKLEHRDAEKVLGIMRYRTHPIQWISVLGTPSFDKSIGSQGVATIANADADADSSTTLKCAWSFPAGSTQAISDHFKHRSPPLRWVDQYHYGPPVSPMEAWPRETIVASGRLGHYNGETCLHLYYLHRLTAEDGANFRHKAREYKDTILDCDWVFASMDTIDTSYEETFARIIQYPTAKETVDGNSKARPALDWKCTKQACGRLNHSYCNFCAYCRNLRPPLPMLPPCPCKICHDISQYIVTSATGINQALPALPALLHR